MTPIIGRIPGLSSVNLYDDAVLYASQKVTAATFPSSLVRRPTFLDPNL